MLGFGSSRKFQNFGMTLSLSEKDLYESKDSDELRDSLQTRQPWVANARAFKTVKISALALVKMVSHAQSGGDIEVMGLMQGKVRDGEFIVLDSFPLPVEGTETRVNAGAAAEEFMIRYTETSEHLLSDDYVVGWYHSHPGYGCWLSGIDVQTQALYQQAQEPFLAIVIDPKKTIAQGKVEIGAFRTLSGETESSAESSKLARANLPLEKIEDFGVHANQYYPLDVEFFQTEYDQNLLSHFWAGLWTESLASSPLEQNASYMRSQISQVTKKVIAGDKRGSADAGNKKQGHSACADHACSLGHQALHGLAVAICRKSLFAKRPSSMDTS